MRYPGEDISKRDLAILMSVKHYSHINIIQESQFVKKTPKLKNFHGSSPPLILGRDLKFLDQNNLGRHEEKIKLRGAKVKGGSKILGGGL